MLYIYVMLFFLCAYDSVICICMRVFFYIINLFLCYVCFVIILYVCVTTVFLSFMYIIIIMPFQTRGWEEHTVIDCIIIVTMTSQHSLTVYILHMYGEYSILTLYRICSLKQFIKTFNSNFILI